MTLIPKPLRHIPKLEAKAVLLALAVGIVLTSAKFTGYFLTGSAVIFSDALESIVNLAASIFALYSLAVAHLPADESHPYGHGKVEFLAVGFEGGMILIAGIMSLVKAVDVFRNIDQAFQPQNLAIALVLMAGALVVNGITGLCLIRTGRKLGSVTLEADGHHLMSDAWTSVAALVAVLAVKLTGWAWLDPLAAILVAGYIAWVGIGLLRRAEAGLTDRQDRSDAALLSGILDAHLPGGSKSPTVCSYHKVRHRHAGRYHWVDFHLVVPADWDVLKGHQVATAIEEELEAAIGEGNATAHVEPCIRDQCTQCGRPA
ncbi:cation diffusion facilitator family transporter [Humisphaera borealis]|uniref:Cation transporter n=1 Tax=Humisphaera borealis TaxID=2807512 RepID=A0A7M2WUT3_9BACT|nr:cation diffusion facilitator family transporter [Humisphaera borealis]QOV88300.1 cation transporter [Humisphaera borealis]